MKESFKLLILLLICLSVFILVMQDIHNHNQYSKEESETTREYLYPEEITCKEITHCDNMTTLETAECLNEFVNLVYIYRYTRIDVPMHELLNYGGDCRDWTKFYNDCLKEYGIKTTIQQSFFYKAGKGHRFLIVYDETGSYCILDQEMMNCVELDGGDET